MKKDKFLNAFEQFEGQKIDRADLSSIKAGTTATKQTKYDCDTNGDGKADSCCYDADTTLPADTISTDSLPAVAYSSPTSSFSSSVSISSFSASV